MCLVYSFLVRSTGAKTYLTIILITLGIGTLLSQEDRIDLMKSMIDSTTSDSLKGACFYELAYLLRLQDLKLAYSYSDSGLVYFKKIKDDAGIHLKPYLDGTLAGIAGDLELAIKLNQAHYDWALEKNNYIRQTYALSGLSKYSKEKGDLSAAIDYTLRGIALQDSIGRSFDNGFFYAELGDMYTQMQLWDQAKKYIQLSYDLAEEMDFTIGQSFSLRNLASNALSQSNTEEAIRYVEQALKLDSSINYLNGLSKSHRDLGAIYEQSRSLEKAIHHYDLALRYLENTDNPLDFAKVYQGLSRVHLAKRQRAKAMHFHQLAANYRDQLEDLQYLVEQDLLGAKIWEFNGQHEKANRAWKSHYENQNKLLNRDIANRITGLNIAFETKQKEQEINLLNTENEMANLKLSTSLRRNILLGIGLVMFGLFTFFLFRLNRKVKAQNKTISKALKEKETLLQEIHHRVKNNLQLVSSLLSLQSEHVEDSSAHSALMQGQNRVQSMALIHQNLYQGEHLTSIDIKTYLQKLVSNLIDTHSIDDKKIEFEMNIEALEIDIDTAIPLGLITNELVINSLKHAFKNKSKGVITVELYEDEKALTLVVSDNGIGLEKEEEILDEHSFGFRLVKAFTTQLEAKLEILTQEGTSFVLRVPAYGTAA